MATDNKRVEQDAALARQQYADLGVDVQAALDHLARIPISLHCWQGDDVGELDVSDDLGGGLAVTGNYPGKARTPAQLRTDLETAVGLIPGRHRLNLHAIYPETDRTPVDNEIEPTHFQGWIDWARQQSSASTSTPPTSRTPSPTTASPSRPPTRRPAVLDRARPRDRRIGAEIGQTLGTPCVTNVWIPDG